MPQLPAGYEELAALVDYSQAHGYKDTSASQVRSVDGSIAWMETLAARGDLEAARLLQAYRSASNEKAKSASANCEPQSQEWLDAGPFFRLCPAFSALTAHVKKETYDKGDTVFSIVDTRNGTRAEIGPLGGIENGLQIKVMQLLTLGDSLIVNLADSMLKKLPGHKRLVRKPGLEVYAKNVEVEGGRGRAYLIITPKGVLSGIEVGGSPQDIEDYDRMLMSAIPIREADEETASREEAEVPCEDEQRLRHEAQASVSKPESDDAIRQLAERNCVLLNRYLSKCPEMLKVLKERYRACDSKASLLRIRLSQRREDYDRRLNDAREKAQKAEQAVQDNTEARKQAEKELSTLGIFAFSRKKELGASIEQLRSQQTELERQREAGNAAYRALEEEHVKAISDQEHEMQAAMAMAEKAKQDIAVQEKDEEEARHALNHMKFVLALMERGKSVSGPVQPWREPVRSIPELDGIAPASGADPVRKKK